MSRAFDRLLGALGIDARQWRALVIVYLRIDFRPAGGAERRGRKGRPGASPLAGLLFVSVIASAAFALIAGNMANAVVSASLLTTYSAASTIMLLLVDFVGVVLSPDDYGILGPRPVGPRTYFAARLASVAAYVGAVSLVSASLPALVYGLRIGPAAAVAAIAAVVLCNLSTATIVINGYVTLLRWVHPARLRRAMSYLQLGGAMAFYVIYYLATQIFRGTALDTVDLAASPWLWAIPTTWYGALVGVAGGARGPVWVAAGAALALTALCVPLAAGRLSLDYSRRIGEMSAVAEGPRKSWSPRLPGFRRGEARAIALLVRAQFRFDPRFRLGVLGILPLTIFYLLLGIHDGALEDPFVAGSRHGGPGVFMAVAFIPMTLHAALTVSESWRAAWIFYATPASPRRIVVAAKNFVAVYFLGGYVLVLTAIWGYAFERVWHAAVHALFAGLLAHLLLQLTVIVNPGLPFAAEPRKAERSAAMFAIIAVGAVAAGVCPLILPQLYQSGALTAGALAAIVAATFAIEVAMRMRVDEAVGELEFRN